MASPRMQAAYSQDEIHEVAWNGRTDQGRVVGSGIYIVLLEAGDYRSRSKIAVIK